MKCLLIYYTGTFNTRYLTKLLKQKLEKENVQVDIYEINPLNYEKLNLQDYDLIGLGYPIYGFNAPCPFVKFIKKQKFLANQKVFIYKNSGETYDANEASSISIVKKVRKDKAIIENEYHFIMPYNIHFRFEEPLIKEMLGYDDMLLDILVKEVLSNVTNIKKYKLINRLITFVVKIQYIGGNVNSFLYKVDKDKCVNCDKCIQNCPTQNIYRNKKGKIKFHHNCLMCMRCSFYCPKDAINIGFLQGWKVNGPYDFEKIAKLENKEKIIKEDTQGFFKCYVSTYKEIEERYKKIFNK